MRWLQLINVLRYTSWRSHTHTKKKEYWIQQSARLRISPLLVYSKYKHVNLCLLLRTWRWVWPCWSIPSAARSVWSDGWSESHTQYVHINFPLLGSSNTCSAIGQSWVDLGLVELQFVVGDPPGLLGLQPLCSLLLHVVLLQPVRLDQLLKTQLTAKPHGDVTVLQQCHQTTQR